MDLTEIVQLIERLQRRLRSMKVGAELSHKRSVEDLEAMIDLLKHKIGRLK